MKKIITVFFITSLFCSISLCAQTLISSNRIPNADGTIQLEEYSFSKKSNGAVLYFSLSSDHAILYAAIDSPTEGWAAIGLGSKKMNGSYIVIGSKNNGKISIQEETGKSFWHHSKNSKKILLTQAVNEKDGRTILEFSVSAKQFIQKDVLKCIAAWSTNDSFKSKHLKHFSLQITIQ